MKLIKENHFILFFLIIFISLLAKLYISRNNFIEGWDESIYTQLGVEFTKKPDFTLFYNSEPWLEKPFLIGWITGILHFVSPYNTMLSRSFFSLIGTIDLYFIWKITKKMLSFGSELRKNVVSLLSPVSVLTTYLFLERSTTINTDIILVFGLLGYYLYKEKFWIKLLFLCIAVWSKSLLGFLPLVLDVTLNFKQNLTRKSILVNLLLVFIPSIWYIYGFLKFGIVFIKKHFVEQIFSRASTTLESHAGEWWFYLEYFIKTSPTAIFLIAISLIYSLHNFFKGYLKVECDIKKYSPLVTGLVFFIIISISKSKLEWYLLPSLFLISPIIPLIWEKANKYMITIIVIIFSFFGLMMNFMTPLSSRNSIDHLELTKIANCISSLPQKTVILYQNNQSILEYNKLNDSGGSISSTFRYGGNPAFIYYAKKEKISFVYNDKLNDLNQNSIIVTSKDKDLHDNFKLISGCTTNNYNVFTND